MRRKVKKNRDKEGGGAILLSFFLMDEVFVFISFILTGKYGNTITRQ
jgi:hypothetical protein